MIVEEGELTEEKQTTILQNAITMKIVSCLFSAVKSQKSGYLFGVNQKFAISGLGTKTKMPDVAFESFERLPKVSDVSVFPLVADFAVEVYSRIGSN